MPSVLIVDDTPANLELLAGMLKEKGCKVRAALNGRLALESVHSSPPDLILLDINMPEMNGYELCEILKSDIKYKEIPVIFLSASTEMVDKVKAFGVGGADYITKPFQLEEVQARVDTQLTLKKAREYLEDKNRFLEYTFSRFVSPKVVETMKLLPISGLLKMERCEVTILFADLRGFTSLANEISPEEVQETLNSFLSVMVKCLEDNDGMVDKFMGDGLMALFGAPFRQNDHAQRALSAAVAMQEAHRGWLQARAAVGKPARQMGIGIATGQVVAGAYGTANRMEYTALGHAVNLASRLCGAAQGGEILTIRETLEKTVSVVTVPAANAAAPAFAFSAKGRLSFKNIAEPVEVLSVTYGA